ncbi:hypothetical protein MOC76_16680 [Bacillus spizizenii]|uniref:hypothetical protein n=1 Tax=Bacillus subtilis group TaxID=653685 RepID=UPI00228232A1|nr:MULTISPECIES: hypothetical protein [Bacillus subtilis group]MCY7902019.1 hypothetical protein [Bacillus inaquosorum]MCY8063928.1 hypothetical protein [Bacillus spizizenii]MCY8135398.1 hypothetical protein [Bacillus spizizenii]MCY8256974.1 hypothetical protein [Bacillus spizizenii]MCY8264681.1 hypothetical protein [Bacillus inaquosorum]
MKLKFVAIGALALSLLGSSFNSAEATSSRSIDTPKKDSVITPMDVTLYSGTPTWSNGEAYAVFDASYKETRVLINNYSSKSVKYDISIGTTKLVSGKTLDGSTYVYEPLTRPIIYSGKYSVRLYTSDSSTRSVGVRAVGITN